MTTPFKADLHCHSNCSDGTDSPKELIDLALSIGLKGLSITDHDTPSAYREAEPYAKEKGLSLLRGIEFSASYHSDPVHVLGYNYDIDNPAFIRLCAHHINRRRERNEKILRKLKALGIAITYDEVIQAALGETVGRPHIALVLIQKGIVQNLKEAFEKYLGEGKAAFDPGEPVSVERTIEVIKAAKGKALLAHPHLIKKESLIAKLLKMPFDGLEVYYAGFGPAAEARWLQIAKNRQWLISGGSDYHGTVKPLNTLGSSWVDYETFQALAS